MFIDGKPIGALTSIELPTLPKPRNVAEFVLLKDFEFRATLEVATMNMMASVLREMQLYHARHTMTKRGFRRWRARYWRKAHP